MMLSDVYLSVAYIGPKSKTERLKLAQSHVTRDSDTTFKVRRSKVNLFDGQKRHSLRPYSAAFICPAPCKLTFDLLILKVVSESRVTWPTSVPILVFLDLSVLNLGPMYAADRHTSDAHHRLMSPALGAGA